MFRASFYHIASTSTMVTFVNIWSEVKAERDRLGGVLVGQERAQIVYKHQRVVVALQIPVIVIHFRVQVFERQEHFGCQRFVLIVNKPRRFYHVE